ncbi:MAG TPA: hypothetical protein VN947_10335 [Polyangia bacterium]|nr:hypothetical protein [Polyangia bacterium]
MAPARCPRCGSPLADTASSCAGCARPVTLDLTARVPKKAKRPGRKLFLRDAVLMLGGAGGIAAASVSDNYWVAGGVVAAAAVIAIAIHYIAKE